MSTQDYLGQEEAPIGPPTSDEKTMGILSHILCLAAGFIAPLVIYLIKKDESPFVREHAKESLNFQITLFILYIISFFLIFIFIGILMMVVLGIGALVLIIVATVKASEGKLYRYPFNIRLIK
jgi:uncharacterized protein